MLLSIRLLGRPEASYGEQPPLRFGTKKKRALLCYLAAKGGRHPRRELAEILWPESEKRHARADLRAVLSEFRKTLREDKAYDRVARFFVIDRDLLGVDAREVELDLNTLEAAVSLARSETSSGGSTDAVGHRDLIGRLKGTLGLYWGSSWRASRLRRPTSTSCALRPSGRGGARPWLGGGGDPAARRRGPVSRCCPSAGSWSAPSAG